MVHPFSYRSQAFPHVMTTEETINYILEGELSVARFGDGELSIMAGTGSPHFQNWDKKMGRELKEVAISEDLLVCIPNVFCEDKNKVLYTEKNQLWWKGYLRKHQYYWKKYFRKDNYGDANISRFYLPRKNKEESNLIADQLKRIWDDRSVVFIEGEQSRLGMGNDFFNNTRSIERVIAPKKNAYTVIDGIEDFITQNIKKNKLILLALGPTATILAWRLAKKGYQAIDVGHIDIEYEWMKMKATNGVPIKNKFTNEAGDSRNGRKIDNLVSEEYQNQIIKSFVSGKEI